MKRGRGVLGDGNTPPSLLPRGNERLNRIDLGLEVRLPRRHHPRDRAEDGHLGSQKAHVSGFSHEGSGLVIAKDPAQIDSISDRPLFMLPSKPTTFPSSANKDAKSSALRRFQEASSF